MTPQECVDQFIGNIHIHSNGKAQCDECKADAVYYVKWITGDTYTCITLCDKHKSTYAGKLIEVLEENLLKDNKVCSCDPAYVVAVDLPFKYEITEYWEEIDERKTYLLHEVNYSQSEFNEIVRLCAEYAFNSYLTDPTFNDEHYLEESYVRPIAFDIINKLIESYGFKYHKDTYFPIRIPNVPTAAKLNFWSLDWRYYEIFAKRYPDEINLIEVIKGLGYKYEYDDMITAWVPI